MFMLQDIQEIMKMLGIKNYDYISYRKTGKLNEKGTVYSGITKTQDEELKRAFNELKKEIVEGLMQ